MTPPVLGLRLVQRLLRHGGTRLINHAVDRMFPGKAPVIDPRAPPPKAKNVIAGTLIGAAAMRLATRSVPGAILVGGAMFAKSRYDRKRAKKGDSGAPELSDT